MIISFKRLVLLSALTVLLGVSLVYAISYGFKHSPSLPSTGTLSVSAYYAVKQPDGSYVGSYVQVPVTVTGPQSRHGTTTANRWSPLNFTVVPGQYSVSGTYENATPLTVTANVSAGSYVNVFLNFGSSPPPPLSLTPTAEGVNDGLKLTVTLGKTEYTLGEPINITLTITNISNQTVNFSLAPSTWDFLVYNNTNNTIFEWLKSGRAFPMWVQNVPLDPGMSLADVFTWPQTFWIWNTTGASQGLVSPGTYYIVGQYSTYSLRTTPIQVTIVKP